MSRRPARPLERLVALAALPALWLALAGTALPLLRSGRPALARPAAKAPEGYWHTLANGDRPNVILQQGQILWVGTQAGGLVRWDLDTRTYRQYLSPQDGLPGNDVNAIVAWPDGALWLATSRGLARLDPSSGDVTVVDPTVSADMPARNVTALLATGDGGLWVGFSQEWDPAAKHPDPLVTETGNFRPGGLARYWPADDRWDLIEHVAFDDVPGQTSVSYRSIPSENVTVLALDPAGRLWVGTQPYLTWEPEDCAEGACPGMGQWVPTGGGLAAREGEVWQQWVPTEAGSSSCYASTITDFAVDAQGRTWVATRGRGVLVMRDGLSAVGCANQVHFSRALRDDLGLRGNLVWSIDIDDRGRVWMGHGDSPIRGQGIAILDYGGTLDDWNTPWNSNDVWTFVGFDGVEGGTAALIAVLRRSGGQWLVGAKDDDNGDGYGMRLYDPASGTWEALRTADTGMPSNRISDMAVDPTSGALWFALRSRGVARYQPQTDTWSWWQAYQNAAGVADTLASAEQGARRVEVDLDQAAYDAAFPEDPRYARIGADPTLYEVTGYGSARSGTGPFIYLSPVLQHPVAKGAPIHSVARGPASNLSRRVAVGSDGSAWVGGGLSMWRDGPVVGSQCDTYPQCYIDGGLGHWDGSSWTVYNDKNSSLPRNGVGAVEVSAVLVDAAGHVWAATGDGRSAGDGIGVLDPATGHWQIHRYADGLTAGDGAADFALDPVTGDVWAAHHPVLGYVTLPNGQQQRYFDGGGASRWNGSVWRSWTKPNATLRLFGDKGIAESVLVDRHSGLAWLGGWDGNPVTYHWGLGRDVDASLNWCPLDSCTDGAWAAKVWPDDGTVAALALDQDGRVWAGTNRAETGLAPPVDGVKLFDQGAWSELTTSNSGVAGDEVSALAAQGDRMWVGTLSRGASLFTAGAAPTATPSASPTATATDVPTATGTDEPTPTVSSTSQTPATPTAGTNTPVPSATPTLSGVCVPGRPCTVHLPFALR